MELITRMPTDTICIATVQATEVPFPVIIKNKLTDSLSADRPVPRMDDAYCYTHDQRSALDQSGFSDSGKLQNVWVAILQEALYPSPNGTARLHPFSFDPVRKMMLCMTIAEPRPVATRKAIDAFLTLRLSHESLTTDDDRRAILDFVAEYGPFVPFDCLGDWSPIGSLSEAWHSLKIEKTVWSQPDPAFDLAFIELQKELSHLGAKWVSWRQETSPPPAMRFDVLPYRTVDSMGHTVPELILGFPNHTQRHRGGQFLHFFEYFACWHEVAVKIDNSICRKRADDAVADALKNMRGACMQADQKPITGGKVVRLERTQTAKRGADGAAALVDYMERRIALLDPDYRDAKSKAVLAEFGDNIDRKIEQAKRRVGGAQTFETKPRKRRIADAKPLDLTPEERELADAFSRMLLSKVSSTDSPTRRKIDEFREWIGIQTRYELRGSGVEKDVQANEVYRERWQNELARLEAIKEAVSKALEELKAENEDWYKILFQEDVKRDKQSAVMRSLGISSPDTYNKKRNAAIARFAELCPLHTLDPDPQFIKSKPGPKSANP